MLPGGPSASSHCPSHPCPPPAESHCPDEAEQGAGTLWLLLARWAVRGPGHSGSPRALALPSLVSRPRCSARGAWTAAAATQPSVQGPCHHPPQYCGVCSFFWCYIDLTWGLSPLASSFLPALSCPGTAVTSGAGKGAPEEGLVAP